jgi:hypothetical protein
MPGLEIRRPWPISPRAGKRPFGVRLSDTQVATAGLQWAIDEEGFRLRQVPPSDGSGTEWIKQRRVACQLCGRSTKDFRKDALNLQFQQLDETSMVQLAPGGNGG